MNIVRREKALEDLADLAFYIANDDADAADRFLDAFEASIAQLSQMPYLGVAHPAGNPALFGLRRWPIKEFAKHLIFYLVFEDTIDIVRVLHAARDLERILDKE
ncbi:MAG TPA: type II toxin-antitoxin system RelE/ParE family toxin [Blastocatellia bacterium]|nr:type II toxin-antitoxin system RelE/ParE family toxin [Blastocatellia bacterium]HMV81658.1 type II toxin-antitoxin system RelE/ParE family toxin [Blastocatellia bacterium]HMX26547.1 type II toxin-antitoxin system RelE/ParE family toxin [Blastocatellia bacterium]HMZ20259.1 type II toxin-antitoxin system RelE/ParE family toxin [Blastocatellia bacterium]HNG32148.1 type II toxin-antitoxin system RelE/ParE family toxin [Blastocatellia bacterium]